MEKKVYGDWVTVCLSIERHGCVSPDFVDREAVSVGASCQVAFRRM